ncbi:flotillin family protein [bacterium]|nr:flotillin family protein [bacterium]
MHSQLMAMGQNSLFMADFLGTLISVVTTSFGVAIALVVLIMVVQQFRRVCFPNELLVFTGRRYSLPDGKESNMKVLFGGGGWRMPIVERVYTMDMTTLPIEVTVRNAYSKGNIPLNVQCIANIKVSNNPKIVGNAIERFLGKSEKELQRVAKETLEANLRNILATLTPEQVNEDRLKFALAVGEEVEEDLEKLGLMLDTLKIQHVSDESQYLDSIGRKRIAEVVKDAEIAESDANRASETFHANRMAKAKVSQENAQKAILQAGNKYQALKAELDNQVIGIQNEVEASAREARAEAEQALQQFRQQLEQTRLQADVVLPALADKRAKELIAEGQAAPILENAKALAETLEMLAQQWAAAGDEARNIFLIQQIETLTQTVVDSIKEMEIGEVNLLDDGQGNALRNYVAGFPATISSIIKAVNETIGVDISEILKEKQSSTR